MGVGIMRALLVLVVLAAPLAAQTGYRKHSLRLSMGAGLPRADLKPFFEDSFNLGFGYGYRFHRNFQADIGLDTVFYAARVEDYYQTQYGELRIRDKQYLVPFGGRAIVPLGGERVLFYGGGGGTYMRYQESIRQPFGDYYRFDCPVCRSRSGWGYYAVLGVSFSLDRSGHLRLGAGSRVYRGETSGDALGALPPIRTQDRWLTTMGEFTLSF